MIKYIGSKRALLPWILSVVRTLKRIDPEIRRVLDPFSGSCRVSHALKAEGFEVLSGDYLYFAYILAQALIEADAREYPPTQIEPILRYLESLPASEEGWFTRRYAYEARFFQPFNAKRIERIRQEIDAIAQTDLYLRAILLTSLLLGADKVDSTTGVQMAYLKEWAPRSYNPLRLEYPPLLPGVGKAFHGDALEWTPSLEVDLAYLDPPYNQHSYLGNYHVWETLMRFDDPATYGVAVKRIECRQRKSPFNSRKEASHALRYMLKNLRSKYILLSFSDEGFFTKEELLRICQERGAVRVLARPHRRYVGALIGIYNPQGERVGKVSHTRNTEYLFLIAEQEEILRAFPQEEKEGLFPYQGELFSL